MSSSLTLDAEQVERNFLRLASAETPKQLEAFVLKNLVNCIDLASNANENVKTQGVELLTHLNKRLKGNEDVQLPVEQILANFQNYSSGSLSSNFAMIYIKMGYGRLGMNDQLRLLPKLLESSKGKPRRQQNELFAVSAPVFYELAGRKPVEWPALNLNKDDALRAQVLSFFADILLIPPSGAAEHAGNESTTVPSGMSKEGFDRVRTLSVNKDE
uniref:Proteasome component Ecm29 N-terminal domain-containing protein n=2 Tax=Plectus sambesii TaxID=2011161 RepID=A0A914WPR6_9BILA